MKWNELLPGDLFFPKIPKYDIDRKIFTLVITNPQRKTFEQSTDRTLIYWQALIKFKDNSVIMTQEVEYSSDIESYYVLRRGNIINK